MQAHIKLFVAIYALIGMFYVFLMPPFQAPDENSHFSRLMSISRGDIFPIQNNVHYGHMLPDDLNAYIDKHLNINTKVDEKYSYKEWHGDSHTRIDNPAKLSFIKFSASGFSPVYYLPQLAGLGVGHLAFLFSEESYNWQSKLYFARIGSLIFSIGIVLLVVEILPTIRLSLFFAVMLPMPLLMSAAVSADPILNGASVLWLACIIRLRRGVKITPIVASAFYFSALVLAHVKLVYAPLLALIWLLKPYVSKSDFYLLIKGVALTSIIGLCLSAFVFPQVTPIELVAETKAQVQFLIHHPARAILIPFRSLIANQQFYFISLFANFGSLDTNLPLSLVVLIACVFFASAVIDRMGEAEEKLNLFEIVFLWAVIGIVIVGIFDANYVIWTSHTKGVGAPLVDGVQGRYFIPLLPYIALLLFGMPIKKNFKIRHSGSWVILFCLCGVFFHLISIFAIVFRYWVN